MKVTQEIVRIFWEEGEKRIILFKNGTTEFYKLKRATNDDIDDILGVNAKLDDKGTSTN